MNSLFINKSEGEPTIFESVQGEGLQMGVPSFFIRLQGCSVHCFFCDEKETWSDIHGDQNSMEMSFDEIITKLEALNPLLKRVVITGGEPCEQKLSGFIKTLQENLFTVAIESSGTGKYVSDLFLDYLQPLWITFSPKEIYSPHKLVSEGQIWAKASEIKFVVANEKAESYIFEEIIPRKDAAKNPCPIFLVPDWFNFDENKERVLKLCRDYPSRFRIGVQGHKYLSLK